MANVELFSFRSAEELARAAADSWLDEISAANRAGTAHTTALSGGRIAQNFFTASVTQAAVRNVSFDRVHFFWADERCVPANDPDSNFKTANELLLAPLKIQPAQIHRLRGEEPPGAAVERAEQEARAIAPTNQHGLPVLDLIVLGMGEDGHIASLFPENIAKNLDISVPFLSVNNSPKPPPQRISMSYKMIIAAKNIWVLVAGRGKADALHQSLSPGGRTPLARVIQSRPATIFSVINEF